MGSINLAQKIAFGLSTHSPVFLASTLSELEVQHTILFLRLFSYELLV